MKKFLIIQTAFIGDVILATPLIEKLHKHYPGAAIDFLLRKGNEGLLQGHPHIRTLLVWDKGHQKWRTLFNLMRRIRQGHYDHVINLQRFAATGILTAFSGAGETCGFSKNPLSFLFSRRIGHSLRMHEDNPHETIRNQALIFHLTDNTPEKPRLYPSPNDYESVKPFKTAPYICIAPASVWFTKQLPVSQWQKLLEAIERPLNVYFLGSKSDSPMAEEIMQGSPNPLLTMHNLCGRLSLLASAALMQDALMNYVNDSAPLHVCSAMDAPTTAFFCSTLPSFGFGPLASRSIVVETQEKLKCRPCGNHGLAACPEGHFKCALGIDTTSINTSSGERTMVMPKW